MGSHRQQMHRNALEAAQFGVGISLVPGPPIIPDGNCIIKAAISQVREAIVQKITEFYEIIS